MVNLSLEQVKEIVVVNQPSVKQKIAYLGVNYREFVTDTDVNTVSRIDLILESLELKKRELDVLNLVNIFFYQYLASTATYQLFEEVKNNQLVTLKETIIDLIRKGYRSQGDLVAVNSELRQINSTLDSLKEYKASCLKRLSLLAEVPELEIENLDEELDKFLLELPPLVTDETVSNVLKYNSDITVAQLLIYRAQKDIDSVSLFNNNNLSPINNLTKSKGLKSNLNDQFFELPKTELSLQDRVEDLYFHYNSAEISYRESVEIFEYQKKIYEKLRNRYSMESNRIDIPSITEVRLSLKEYWNVSLRKIDSLLTWRNVYELFTILSS